MKRLNAFVGRNNHLVIGNGKTLVMSIYAYKLKHNTDYKLISNYDLEYADQKFESQNYSKALLEYEKSVIAIDELPSIISAYSGVSEKGEQFRNFLRQLRKKDLVILTTAQVINDVPAFMRRQGINIYQVYKVHKDKTFCDTPENKNCSYNDHAYLVVRFNGYPKVVTPHLITEDGRIKDYFYGVYESEEIINVNKDD